MQTKRPPKYFRTRMLFFGIYLLHLLLFGVGRILLRRVSMEVRGAENISDIRQGAIFAPNHTSVFDPFILCIALARSRLLMRVLPLVSVAREKSFYRGMAYPQEYLYGGLWFRLLGALAVTPRSAQDPKHSMGDTLAMHAALLKEGFYVLIFPEGHITKDGELLPPKLGASKLAQRTQKPLIPVALAGSFHLHPWKLITGQTHVVVSFAKPIYPFPTTEKIPDGCHSAISTEMMRRIAQALKKPASA